MHFKPTKMENYFVFLVCFPVPIDAEVLSPSSPILTICSESSLRLLPYSHCSVKWLYLLTLSLPQYFTKRNGPKPASEVWDYPVDRRKMIQAPVPACHLSQSCQSVCFQI